MSREIKFRAWDKKESRYYYHAEDAYDCLDGLVARNFGDLLKSDRYDVEQYTGEKDKNGEEIYDGDIIQVDGEDCRVLWDFAAWRFERKAGYFTLGVLSPEDIAVVGNVHENPELVKEDK